MDMTQYHNHHGLTSVPWVNKAETMSGERKPMDVKALLAFRC